MSGKCCAIRLRTPSTSAQQIKDLTEQNPAKDLRFVFSTGDQIDSLSLQGTIVDAVSGEPVDGALFMLYNNLADSVVRTEKPFYFGRTNKEGRFKIENIKAGTFKGLALVDSDFNYLFNFKTERIGFTDSLIVIPADTAANLTVKLFAEEIPIQIKDSELKGYGSAKIVFNRVPGGLNLRYDPPGAIVYKPRSPIPSGCGTARMIPPPCERFILRQILLSAIRSLFESGHQRSFSENSQTARRRCPFCRIAVEGEPRQGIPHPVQSPLSGHRHLAFGRVEDTTRTRIPAQIRISESAPHELLIGWPWKEGKRYEMELLPGAVHNWYGLANDSLMKKWIVEPVKSFGNIKLTIEGLDPGLNYVAELLFQENNVVEKLLIENSETYQRSFTLLPPGNYSLRIVTDLNQNGRWDAGLYDAKRQPEPIFKTKLEPLRANWDLETKVVVE